jgi:hypothetical protein
MGGTSIGPAHQVVDETTKTFPYHTNHMDQRICAGMSIEFFIPFNLCFAVIAEVGPKCEQNGVERKPAFGSSAI